VDNLSRNTAERRYADILEDGTAFRRHFNRQTRLDCSRRQTARKCV